MPEVTSARDNPGTLREYEMVLILRPDTLQDGILGLNNRIKELVDAADGRLQLVENWGKRRLAYEIKKQLKGIYMYYQFLGHADMVYELERNFRMLEQVIRYFTLRIDENVDPGARPEEFSDEDFLAASATRPDEEELATGYVVTGTGEKIPVSELGYEKKGKKDGDGEAKADDDKADDAPKADEAKADDAPAEEKAPETDKPAAEEKPAADEPKKDEEA